MLPDFDQSSPGIRVLLLTRESSCSATTDFSSIALNECTALSLSISSRLSLEPFLTEKP
jgi:hypothetical protein